MTKKKELIISSIIVLIFVILWWIFKPVKINGNAMAPNYHENDKWIVNKLQYKFSVPKRGDVVIFRYYNQQGFEYIGRIIGLPKEKLAIKLGKVFINNVELKENYLSPGVLTKTMNPVKMEWIDETKGKLVEIEANKIIEEGVEILIPENEYFVLMDNREKAADSRSLGFVKEKDIIGSLFLKY